MQEIFCISMGTNVLGEFIFGGTGVEGCGYYCSFALGFF